MFVSLPPDSKIDRIWVGGVDLSDITVTSLAVRSVISKLKSNNLFDRKAAFYEHDILGNLSAFIAFISE